jgi:tRNA U34 5-methylaminomethyl-2-thiouridine-forming methyltransferase MnmC
MNKQYPEVLLKTTEDGSSTLYRPDIEEHYHSIHGAIQESMHVFINAGLKHHPAKHLNILEVGFGTGLNALLTLINIKDHNIYYHAIEKYPLPDELVLKINHPEHIQNVNAKTYFYHLHKAPWNSIAEIIPEFSLYKEKTDLTSFQPNTKFDLVYFDAFAPDKQPELWEPEIFNTISASMNTEAILTTYSSKGSVKRAMQIAGLIIEKIPGPPGKREMLRAFKK